MVYRMKFASTIFMAQQLVAHGHILVNGKKVDIRSFQVTPGMEISIKEKSQKNPLVKEAATNAMRSIPEYCAVDNDKFKGVLQSPPEHDQIPLPLEINVAIVCEYLAHAN